MIIGKYLRSNLAIFCIENSWYYYNSGQILRMTHVARGLDSEGILQVDIIIDGEVPRLPDGATVVVVPFVEDYIQTGPGELL